MRCIFALINDATYPLATNQSELDAENKKLIPGSPDSRGHMGKVLREYENVWDYGSGIASVHQQYHDLLNMCHNLPYTARIADRSIYGSGRLQA